MRVFEALTEAFVDEGTRIVFNLMGDGNKLWLVEMASRPQVRLVNARHEGAALAMADGFARTSGDVGVCAVTYGPGVTQLPTSLMVARKRRAPLVILAADIAASLRDSGDHLDMNERALLEAAGASVHELRDPAQAYEMARRAFREARSERRPVALLVASDLQEKATAIAPCDFEPARETTRAVPDPEAIAAAVDLLVTAKRPLLLAGRGAVLSGARASFDEVAERLGALVTTSFGAKGWLDDHPQNVGLSGGFALDATRRVLEQGDCLLAVGVRLNNHTTDNGRLFADGSVVQVDVAPFELPRASLRVDVALPGDADLALRALAAELERRGHRPRGWTPEIRREVGASDPRLAQIDAFPLVTDEAGSDPRALMLELDRSLPVDCRILIGGGHFMGFVAQYLTNTGRRSFEMVFDFMTTGQAVPAAVGAALADSGRTICAFEGDASFMMHVQELDTAARYGAAPLIFVINDEALGAEYHKLRVLGLDPTEALVPMPDLVRLVEALGGRSMRIDRPEDARAVMDWYDPAYGPHVVDCPVTRSVVGPE